MVSTIRFVHCAMDRMNTGDKISGFHVTRAFRSYISVLSIDYNYEISCPGYFSLLGGA